MRVYVQDEAIFVEGYQPEGAIAIETALTNIANMQVINGEVVELLELVEIPLTTSQKADLLLAEIGTIDEQKIALQNKLDELNNLNGAT